MGVCPAGEPVESSLRRADKHTEQRFNTRELIGLDREGPGHRVESRPSHHSLQDVVGITLPFAMHSKTTTAWRAQLPR